MIKKSDIPKFIMAKVKKFGELEEKQNIINMQLQAFCERKGYDFYEFVDVAFSNDEEGDE